MSSKKRARTKARKARNKLVTGSKAVLKVGGQPVAWATGVTYSTNHITIPAPPPVRNPIIMMGGFSVSPLWIDPLSFDAHFSRKKRIGPLVEFMKLLRKFELVDDKELQDIRQRFVSYTKDYRKKGTTNPKNPYLKHVTKRDKKKGKARIT